MRYSKQFYPAKNNGLNIPYLSLALAFCLCHLPTAWAENANCTLKGGGMQVSIEHTPLGCRTMLNEGGQSRQIAWAQSHPKICRDIAERVMAKSGRSAWDCNAAIPVRNASPQNSYVKPQKKPARISIIVDDAILKSSER